MQLKTRWIQGLLCSLTLASCWGVGVPASLAAQTVTIRLGPFQQSVAIADLEKFAKTGKLPQRLQFLSPVLKPELRQLLTKHLSVDPSFANKFVTELIRTPQGKQLIESLGVALPGSTVKNLQATLSLALRQINGLSALTFLEAYPQEDVTVDATKAIALVVRFNANFLQSQVIGLLLERESSVTTNTFNNFGFDPSVIGNETVQQQTLTFKDRKRNRVIPVDIYSSRTNSDEPLVVMSHGFGANRQFLHYLALHLASHGITVAAVEHPGSDVTAVSKASDTANLAQLLPANEFINRPKDISFLLNELAKLNAQPGSLKGKLNTEKVTVIGHSLGGYTALALVGGEVNLQQLRQFCKNSLSIGESPGDWLQCAAASLPNKKLHLQDDRVKSAIALNPLVGNLFGKNGLTQVTKPVLILTGTEDSLTPALKHQIEPFSQLQGTKYLLTAIGGTHLSVGEPTSTVSTATTIVKERRGEETKSLRQLTQGVSLAFVEQLTPKAKIYQPFLTSAYAQSFSTPQLPLRLVSELPASIKFWLGWIPDISYQLSQHKR
ncbi:alpha/beta hydrolase [Aetokthonos hydrillicola]|jgi:predicted dienelactone hydrolase|nr:alpha/beta fold hydrolase [Aetokthonos hydrillicola]